MFWFVVFLLMVGAAFYMYQRLKSIESEIRDEQLREKEGITVQQETPSKPPVAAPSRSGTPSADEEDGIVALIRKSPGIRQTELYCQLDAQNPKQLQQVLKKMADDGEIRREKEGSSFRLYVE